MSPTRWWWIRHAPVVGHGGRIYGQEDHDCDCSNDDLFARLARELPADIEDGDWIEIDRMGAYSNATATHFNGFYPETLVVTNDQPMAAV